MKIDTHFAAQYHEKLHYVQLIVRYVERQCFVELRVRIRNDESGLLLFHSLACPSIEHQYPDVKTWKQRAAITKHEEKRRCE